MRFFFNDTATTEIYTLSLHDALPIFSSRTFWAKRNRSRPRSCAVLCDQGPESNAARAGPRTARSEEHTSELQSRLHLVCRLLLEKNMAPTRDMSLGARARPDHGFQVG